MFWKKLPLACSCAIAAALSVPAAAQEAGDGYLRAAVARTKLADKGEVYTNGVLDPAADYETRDAWHSVVTIGYFPIDIVAVEGSISTPATTNNVPAGSLAGLPNLGDDEFVLATLGASFQPFKGRFRPHLGAGLAFQITTQERDALAVGLNIPNANGPYVNAGASFALANGLELFVDARKAWYDTHATGLLPLDATYTNFAQVDAAAVLDPYTIQLGLGTRFGSARASANVAQPLASDAKWVLKAGVTNLTLADELDLEVGGAPVPGAAISTFEHQTLSVQVGRFFTPNLAVNATLGLPPTIGVYGAGTIGALPKLGDVTYGPTAFTLQWHPLPQGIVRPYVGVGASYMIVFDADDGAFNDLKVSNDLGFAFEGGADFMVARDLGLFVDVKKALLRPEVTGTFMGNPAEARARLDPWALSAGLSLRL